jgi:hypothetical protein
LLFPQKFGLEAFATPVTVLVDMIEANAVRCFKRFANGWLILQRRDLCRFLRQAIL